MSGTTSGVEFTANSNDTDMLVYRGKTILFEVIWGADAPVDITGYSADMQIRDFDGNLMLQMSNGNGKITIGGIDGKLTFSGTEADSRRVTSIGIWELELTSAGGDVYRALSGAVTPVNEVVT